MTALWIILGIVLGLVLGAAAAVFYIFWPR